MSAAAELVNEALMEDVEWDEPVQSVQELAESIGVKEVPPMYIRARKDRPSWRATRGLGGAAMITSACGGAASASAPAQTSRLPVIDFAGLQDKKRRGFTMKELAMACEDWGVFYLINHPIPPSLLQRVQQVASDFFQLPLQEKQVYANTPNSLTGYGSRIGTTKGTILDWGDYFLHYVWPLEDRAFDDVWPQKPTQYRSTIDEYSQEIHELYKTLMIALSVNLGLQPSYLEKAFGKGATHILRINYYPPCPQPHLTLGLGSHSDAGGMTFLLQDQVQGLQVKKDNGWIMVKPIKNALIVNIADQLQILSNGKYKSVEHRAIVNKHKARMTIAIFCNPADDTVIAPAIELIDAWHAPLYRPMTYGEFLASFIKKGLDGKGYIESFKNQNNHT